MRNELDQLAAVHHLLVGMDHDKSLEVGMSESNFFSMKTTDSHGYVCMQNSFSVPFLTIQYLT